MNNQQTTGPGRSAARTGQAPASVRTPPTSLPFPRRASWARLRAGPAAARARTPRGYRNCPALPDSARLTGQHRMLTRATPTAMRRAAAPWSAALPIGWPPAPTSATPPFPAHLLIPFLDSLLIPFLGSRHRDGVPASAFAPAGATGPGRLAQRDFDLGRQVGLLPAPSPDEPPPAATAVLLTAGAPPPPPPPAPPAPAPPPPPP